MAKNSMNTLNFLIALMFPSKEDFPKKGELQYIKPYFGKGFIGMASPDEQPAENHATIGKDLPPCSILLLHGSTI
jgi:hypothetical protein